VVGITDQQNVVNAFPNSDHDSTGAPLLPDRALRAQAR